jgi:hypothetical protein
MLNQRRGIMIKSKNLLPRQLGDTHIRLLRIFKMVIESGGFAAAEIELNISRPAISLAIFIKDAFMSSRTLWFFNYRTRQ